MQHPQRFSVTAANGGALTVNNVSSPLDEDADTFAGYAARWPNKGKEATRIIKWIYKSNVHTIISVGLAATQIYAESTVRGVVIDCYYNFVYLLLDIEEIIYL